MAKAQSKTKPKQKAKAQENDLSHITPEQQQELLRQAKIQYIKMDFWAYCQEMDGEFFSDNKPHLKRIAKALQAVYEGRIKKLSISLPPRAGKSYIISMFCSWTIGNRPKDTIMRCSCVTGLAEDFSYFIRGTIADNEKYHVIFPDVRLKKDRSKIEDWSVTGSKRSTYFCAGVGSNIIGKGANMVAILDDSLTGIEAAMSPTMVEKSWLWYTSDFDSRIEKNCPRINIGTRWTKKDIIGRLTDPYSAEYQEDWETIVVPALDENGKSYCEEIISTEELLEKKKLLPDFIWEAEYMQNPIESKGLLYPVEDMKRFKMSELKGKPDAIFGFTDTADKGADFLCSVIGMKYGEDMFITHVLYTQDPIEITEPLTAALIIKSNCEIMRIESNAGGRSFALNLRKLLNGKSNCAVIYEATTQNKETRMLMKSGYIKEHFYFLEDIEPGSDYDKYFRALTSYVKMGKNEHDDAPDGTTGLAEYTENITGSNGAAKVKAKNGYEDDDDDDIVAYPTMFDL